MYKKVHKPNKPGRCVNRASASLPLGRFQTPRVTRLRRLSTPACGVSAAAVAVAVAAAVAVVVVAALHSVAWRGVACRVERKGGTLFGGAAGGDHQRGREHDLHSEALGAEGWRGGGRGIRNKNKLRAIMVSPSLQLE